MQVLNAKRGIVIEAMKQNRIRTEKHLNLDELRVDYQQKMQIIEEISREKELREKQTQMGRSKWSTRERHTRSKNATTHETSLQKCDYEFYAHTGMQLQRRNRPISEFRRSRVNNRHPESSIITRTLREFWSNLSCGNA